MHRTKSWASNETVGGFVVLYLSKRDLTRASMLPLSEGLLLLQSIFPEELGFAGLRVLNKPNLLTAVSPSSLVSSFHLLVSWFDILQ